MEGSIVATAKDVIRIARNELGTKENPPSSNKVKYNDWFYGRTVSGVKYPWCCVWVCWVFDRAGIVLPLRTASCGELMRAAKVAGQWVVRDFQPGDVVIYDFSGKQKTTEHCGIVEVVLQDYGVQAIEGNTSQSGSQSNGGMVCRKSRPAKYIVGAVRPRFEAEKEDDMDIAQITDKQAYELLMKAQRYAAQLPEPAWSQAEGCWQRAIDAGVINGGNPEGLLKRDEFAAVMGRRGLL